MQEFAEFQSSRGNGMTNGIVLTTLDLCDFAVARDHGALAWRRSEGHGAMSWSCDCILFDFLKVWTRLRVFSRWTPEDPEGLQCAASPTWTSVHTVVRDLKEVVCDVFTHKHVFMELR